MFLSCHYLRSSFPGNYSTTGGVGTNQISYDAAGHKFYLPQGATEGDFESVNTSGNFNIDSTNDASAVSFRGTRNLSGGAGNGQVNASFDAGTKKLTIDLPTTFAAVSNADLRNAINAIPELSATLGGNGAQDTSFSGGIGTDTLTYEESGTTGTINLAGEELAMDCVLIYCCEKHLSPRDPPGYPEKYKCKYQLRVLRLGWRRTEKVSYRNY